MKLKGQHVTGNSMKHNIERERRHLIVLNRKWKLNNMP